MKYANITSVSTLLLVLILGACSRTQVIREEVMVREDHTRVPPGVVEYIWEEPMVEVIDVPPGVDPSGTYYMPAHQAVVEIKQGRWTYFKEDKSKAKDAN